MNEITLSVIMLAYNSENYIKKAIQSVLNQSFKNFELIIIDDCSIDNTLKIISSFNDSRIRVLGNKIWSGIPKLRNQGLELARGEFISFFDSDDLIAPEKFQKQIDFLNQNPDFGMVGTNIQLIDYQDNSIGKLKLTAKSQSIHPIMVFRNYFVNSSVVFRRKLIENMTYHEDLPIVEDYLMWWNIIQKSKARNLNEYLTFYRQHSESVVKQFPEEKLENDKKLFNLIFNDFGFQATNEELDLHTDLRTGSYIFSMKRIRNYYQWFIKLYSYYSNHYNNKKMKPVVLNRWLKVCFKTRKSPLLLIYATALTFSLIFDLNFKRFES